MGANLNWVCRLMSPSKVDNYIQYCTGELYSYGDRPEYTLEMFIDRLLGLDTGNLLKMEAGTAVHKLFESYCLKERSSFEVGDWVIRLPYINYTLQDYPKVREFWCHGNIGSYTILGKIDAATATCAHDLKTTSNIDIERYINSAQWKMYCLMGGYKKFVYDILKVKVQEEERIVTIQDYERLELYPYKNMESEIFGILVAYSSLLQRIQPQILARIDEVAKTEGIIIDKSKFQDAN